MSKILPPELLNPLETEINLAKRSDRITELTPMQVTTLVEFVKSLGDDDYGVVLTYLQFFKAFDDQVLRFPSFEDEDADADVVSVASTSSFSEGVGVFLRLYYELFEITILWGTLSENQKQQFERFVTDKAEVIAIIKEVKQRFDALISRALLAIAQVSQS